MSVRRNRKNPKKLIGLDSIPKKTFKHEAFNFQKGRIYLSILNKCFELNFRISRIGFPFWSLAQVKKQHKILMTFQTTLTYPHGTGYFNYWRQKRSLLRTDLCTL